MKVLFTSLILLASIGTLHAAGDELACTFICAHNDGEPIGIGDAEVYIDCDRNNNPGAPTNTPTEDCHFEAQDACASELGVDDYENVQVERLSCIPQTNTKSQSTRFLGGPQGLR